MKTQPTLQANTDESTSQSNKILKETLDPNDLPAGSDSNGYSSKGSSNTADGEEATQINGQSPESAPALTETEWAALRSNGVSLERIKAIEEERTRSGGKSAKVRPIGRAAMADAIHANTEKFRKFSPKPLWRAQDVATVMNKLGLHEPTRSSRWAGDLLGGHFCKLPVVQLEATRYYDLTYLNASPGEKERRTKELESMGADVLMELTANITTNPTE